LTPQTTAFGVAKSACESPPKAFDVLRYLVENPGRLVTQDELLEALWPDTYVNPEILRNYILDIRKILGDRPDKPVFIETVTKTCQVKLVVHSLFQSP
jgi:DNA-binding winged helix-turn-helix (wHTH) protein